MLNHMVSFMATPQTVLESLIHSVIHQLASLEMGSSSHSIRRGAPRHRNLKCCTPLSHALCVLIEFHARDFKRCVYLMPGEKSHPQHLSSEFRVRTLYLWRSPLLWQIHTSNILLIHLKTPWRHLDHSNVCFCFQQRCHAEVFPNILSSLILSSSRSKGVSHRQWKKSHIGTLIIFFTA